MENNKKVNIRYYIPVLCLMSLILTGCSGTRNEVKETPSVNDEQVKRGEKHFMFHCQKCHPNGEAGLGPPLLNIPAAEFVIKFQVRHGMGTMPAFTEKELSDQDVEDIVKYIESLESEE